MRIIKIVITGGPCAGKSTILEHITQELNDIGRKTFTVQETATRMYGSGIEISERGLSRYQFQEQVLLRQIDEERFMEKIARQHTYENIVILYDRGVMDGQAYNISQEEFDAMIQTNGYTMEEIKHNRYDMVIHLVTAAYGAEDSYTLENNSIRTESIAQARILDDKIQAAWKDHPDRHIIDNSTSFAGKIDRTMQTIKKSLERYSKQ